jgi:hypothetical protein
MAKKLKIGWQKYEDLIEKQLSSPILSNIMKTIAKNNAISQIEDEDEIEDIEEEESIFNDNAGIELNKPFILPVSQQLLEDVTMLSNYDCWIGHTNFDITPIIKEKLNRTPGIEVLKICSRYRFFIGIGNMFDFGDVRKTIEDELLKGK